MLNVLLCALPLYVAALRLAALARRRLSMGPRGRRVSFPAKASSSRSAGEPSWARAIRESPSAAGGPSPFSPIESSTTPRPSTRSRAKSSGESHSRPRIRDEKERTTVRFRLRRSPTVSSTPSARGATSLPCGSTPGSLSFECSWSRSWARRFPTGDSVPRLSSCATPSSSRPEARKNRSPLSTGATAWSSGARAGREWNDSSDVTIWTWRERHVLRALVPQ